MSEQDPMVSTADVSVTVPGGATVTVPITGICGDVPTNPPPGATSEYVFNPKTPTEINQIIHATGNLRGRGSLPTASVTGMPADSFDSLTTQIAVWRYTSGTRKITFVRDNLKNQITQVVAATGKKRTEKQVDKLTDQVWDASLATLVASGIKMDLATTSHIAPVETKAWTIAAATASAACTASCTLACETTCTAGCESGRKGFVPCNQACKSGCTTTCEHYCQTQCEAKCQGWLQ